MNEDGVDGEEPVDAEVLEVIDVDNRNVGERIEDACFEGLIKRYTSKQEWNVVEMINVLYGKVLSDRWQP